MTELPEELWTNIFSRLPAKSVGQCRCLSKQFRTHLSQNPHFIKAHLAGQNSHILLRDSSSLHSISISTLNDHDDAVSTELRIPPLGTSPWNGVLGSCHGLVLALALAAEDEEIYLLNPTTLETARVPPSPLALNWSESETRFGFGYDSSTDDYKVVAVSYYYKYKRNELGRCDMFVDVYRVRSGVWRRVENSPYDHDWDQVDDEGVGYGALVNEVVHWMAISREPGRRRRYVIAAFSLANDVFDEVPSPKGVELEEVERVKLGVLGGCLCLMVSVESDCRWDVWVMKEYGIVESWTRFSFEDEYACDLRYPLCYAGDDDEKAVFVGSPENLYVYYLEGGDLGGMAVKVDGVRADVYGGCTFVESLISPSFSVA